MGRVRSRFRLANAPAPLSRKAVYEMNRADSPRQIVAIDCHAHVMRRDIPLSAERHSAPKGDVTVEQYLAQLDEYHITYGVLTAPSFYGTNNTLLLEALDHARGRLRGTAIVDPSIDRAALEEMGQRGVVGVRLNWIRRDNLPDVDSDEYRRLFEHVRLLGWHVEIYLEGAKLADVLPRIRSCGVTVVADHFGSPTPTKGIACAGFEQVLRGVRAGDTFVKLSAPYRLGGADPQPYVDALLDSGGPAQLVWATDWPFVGHEDSITYRQCVEWIQKWIPDSAIRHVVLAESPARLFHFAPSAAVKSRISEEGS
jgi:predicted TIM-barrel fold metal-dependent hydrolase